jgi:His/Glu/Gln/Arg/opine family amino acid ABC transporter permease subunit
MSLIDIATEYWRPLLEGFKTTLELAVLTTIFGTIVGVLTAIGRMSRWRLLRAITIGYITVIRGTPPLLQLFIIFFSFAQWGFVIPGFTCAVIALGLYAGSYTAEIFRAGILAIPKGQVEAANSIGLKRGQVYRLVILPQALRIIIPPMTNQVIFNLKATSLVVTISVQDVMYVAYNGAAMTFRSAEFYTLAGLMYLTVAIGLGQLAKHFELTTDVSSRKRRKSLKVGEPAVAGGFGGPAT